MRALAAFISRRCHLKQSLCEGGEDAMGEGTRDVCVESVSSSMGSRAQSNYCCDFIQKPENLSLLSYN